MLTEEEEERIIAKATERALLSLPEVIGNLMANHAAMMKLNKDFYDKFPEFRNHKDIVAATLEKVDAEDTLAPYEEKLNKAVPEIKRRIGLVSTLDMENVSKDPNRDFNGLI